MARRARRERITEAFDVFHATVAEVFGAADRLTEAAVRAHAEAMAEMWLRETGLDDARVDPQLTALFANPSLAHVVARVAADREAAFDAWSQDADGSGPERLTGWSPTPRWGLPGDGDDWLEVGKADLGDRVPTAVADRHRDGGPTGPPQTFPVAVPLLDEAHLEIRRPHADTGPPAEALVETLLMRVREPLPTRAGAAAPVGRRPADRLDARPLPAHPHRAAHRARPGPAATTCSTSCPATSAACTPACWSTGTRRCARCAGDRGARTEPWVRRGARSATGEALPRGGTPRSSTGRPQRAGLRHLS